MTSSHKDKNVNSNITSMNEVIELDLFFVESTSVTISGYEMGNKDEVIYNVLPGKYRVFKHYTQNNGDNMYGNLYVLHESVADKKNPLSDHAWENGGLFDMEDNAVKIFDSKNCLNKLSNKQLTTKLSDKMVDVINNTICFTMQYPDYGFYFNILKENNFVVGFNVEGTACWLNTPNKLFLEACQIGDLEKVQYFLKSPELDVHADFDTENYSCYYWACVNGHKEVIKYLLSSPELKEHCNIGTRDNTPFTILCNGKWNVAKDLILELPMKNILEIKEVLKKPNSITKQDEIEPLIKIRENEILNQNSGNKSKA